MSNCCLIHDFKNLENDPKCFKNPRNPTCTDFIKSNKYKCFENSTTIKLDVKGKQLKKPALKRKTLN